jgi:predicted acyltransferase
MVFVNDLGHGAPSWMHHIQPPYADGMTLADVVFPTFLFIVGVSIPLALERASTLGRSKWAQLGHVLTRTAGLLFMGVIYINKEDDVSLRKPWWGLLALSSLVLAWAVVPRERGLKRNVLIALKGIGVLGLMTLVVLFRQKPGPAEIPFSEPIKDWVWLRAGWWEILGLIGWAYVVAAVLTLVLGRRREWLMGSVAILMLVHLAFNRGGLFTHVDSKPWLGELAPVLHSIARGIDVLGKYVSLRDAVGSLAAISVAGCVLGSILRRDSDVTTPRDRTCWALTFAFGLFLAGLVTDTFEGINKIAATPSWCLWCAAIATAVWVLLYRVMDVARFRAWAIPIRPAGANPLVAYFLHPITIWLIEVSGQADNLLAYKESTVPAIVIGGSIAMALYVCVAAGILGRLGLRVRL